MNECLDQNYVMTVWNGMDNLTVKPASHTYLPARFSISNF